MSDQDQKPARGRPRKMSSDAILDVTVNAYWQDDPADVSVNSICQMAGVSKPSLYRTFGSAKTGKAFLEAHKAVHESHGE